uniref:Hepatocyte growth factor-regulated tyrosine kinase substrate n=1 Tax=Syphacia muris TaxID=451379 RepID=A0A0N5AQC4_9BILA
MSKKFLKALDRATDSTLVDPNWDAILECVDLIRGGETQSKAALGAIQKRIHSENPHVAHHGLLVLEACMKNCGSKFHGEVATNEFMHDLRDMAFDNASEKVIVWFSFLFYNVKNKILELLQCWSIAFKEKPEYKIVVDTQKTMEYEGVAFPKISESEAMFVAENAPDWVDGDVCFRCRTAFGLITRKHHCRACGQVFCDKCSSNQSYLPRYGIEREVRVCDGCYEKLPSSKKRGASVDALSGKLSGTSINDPGEGAKTSSPNNTAEDKERELKEAEEFEINLALAISQSEAEAKEQERQRHLYHLFNGVDYSDSNDKVLNASTTNSDSALKDEQNCIYKFSVEKGEIKSLGGTDDAEPEMSLDPELAQYLNKEYWQRRKEAQKEVFNIDHFVIKAAVTEDMRKTAIPSAPPPSESSYSYSASRSEKVVDEQSITTTGGVELMQQKLDGNVTPTAQVITDEEEQTAETMEFCRQIFDEVSNVTKMVNRINSNRARNRSLFNDTAIQSLWSRLTAMLDQVKIRKAKLDEKKTYYESLMDRISNIKYTRAAADQLKEQFLREEEERKRREKEEKQREMLQTAALLRQQKHLWLQTQQREHMRRMLGQNVYQNYFPNATYSTAQIGAVDKSLAQTDGTSYLPAGGSYTQYSNAAGVAPNTGKNQLVMTYGGQCVHPGQVVGVGQQLSADSIQPYGLQQAVGNTFQPPVSSYSSVMPGYMVTVSQQGGYSAPSRAVTTGVEQSTSHHQQQVQQPVAGEQSQMSTVLQQQVQIGSSMQQSHIPVSMQQPLGNDAHFQQHLQSQKSVNSTGVGVMQQISQSGIASCQYANSAVLSQQTKMSNQVFHSLPQHTAAQPVPVAQFQPVGATSASATPSPQVYSVASGVSEQIYSQQLNGQQINGMYTATSVNYPMQSYPYQQVGNQMNYQLPQDQPQQQQQAQQCVIGQYYQDTVITANGSGLPGERPMSQANQEGVIDQPLISFD